MTARVCPRIPSAADVRIRIRFSNTSLRADSPELRALAGSEFFALSTCSFNLAPGLNLPAVLEICRKATAPTQTSFVSVAPCWGRLGRDSCHQRKGSRFQGAFGRRHLLELDSLALLSPPKALWHSSWYLEMLNLTHH